MTALAPTRPSRWDVVAPASARWGLPDAAVVLALLPILVGLGFGFVLLFPETPEQPFSFLHSLLSYLLVGGAIIVVSMRRGQRSLAADFGLSFRWIDLPIGIGLALLGKLAALLYGLLAIVLTGEAPKTPNVAVSHDLAGVLTAILLVTLLGPFVEELLFRGLILRATRYAILRGRRRARPQPAPHRIQVLAAVVAVLVNSALFAGLHLYQAPGDPALFISLALVTLTVGILHSVIVIVTGRLGAAVVSHMLGNGIAVALQFALL